MYKKLKRLRVEKGYSGIYIANIIGICKMYYYQLEKGERRLSYDMAIKIANIFDMKPDELFYEDHIKN